MSQALASIQPILEVAHHPQADRLDLVKVLGFTCIVGRDQWNVGDLVCYIEPDTVLPDGQEWAAFYKAKSSRVRAVKLRNVWSQGIVESLEKVGYTGPVEAGRDIAADIGVTKWSAPEPQDLQAKGGLPFGIPRTDEERTEKLDSVPWGELCDVTLKVDGMSCSFYVVLNEDGTASRGILGRTMEWKPDASNNYTRVEAQYGILDKLERFCRERGVSLCIRGEAYGAGINRSKPNWHAALPLAWAMYKTWLIGEGRYARKGHELYAPRLAAQLGLPAVPMLHQDIALTPELLKLYTDDLEKLDGLCSDGPARFEGVVCDWTTGSCKALSKVYDSLK